MLAWAFLLLLTFKVEVIYKTTCPCIYFKSSIKVMSHSSNVINLAKCVVVSLMNILINTNTP